MIINFLLTFIPITVATVLAILTSGGTLTCIFDSVSFAGTIILFAISIIFSGYTSPFCKIFSTKKKFSNLTLQDLQKIDSALKLATKLFIYTTILVPVAILIYTFRNYYNNSKTLSGVGPNCAIFLTSCLYLCVFEMILFTLKSKVKKSIILYMSETSQNIKKDTSFSAIKFAIGILLFAIISFVYGYISGHFALGNVSFLYSIFDLPALIILFLYVIPLIAISGNLKVLLISISVIFSKNKINITQKNLYLNAIKTTTTLNWFAAFCFTLCGWIAMLCFLEDKTYLLPNISVSIIPIFYTTIFNLFLLLVETRVNKAAE